jgi:hypothetical protein
MPSVAGGGRETSTPLITVTSLLTSSLPARCPLRLLFGKMDSRNASSLGSGAGVMAPPARLLTVRPAAAAARRRPAAPLSGDSPRCNFRGGPCWTSVSDSSAWYARLGELENCSDAGRGELTAEVTAPSMVEVIRCASLASGRGCFSAFLVCTAGEIMNRAEVGENLLPSALVDCQREAKS